MDLQLSLAITLGCFKSFRRYANSLETTRTRLIYKMAKGSEKSRGSWP